LQGPASDGVLHIGKADWGACSQNIGSVPRKADVIFGSQCLEWKFDELFSFALRDALVPIRPFLTGQTFDPETVRLLGVAFEMARAAIKCPRDLSDEIIAGRIIELAKVGERNVEVLSEAALNVPAGAVSAPNPPPVPALPPSIPDSSS
jgi:hypothetical protein